MIVLACAGTAQRGAGSKKKAQDASDGLPGLAVQCMAALFGLCHSAADLAHLLALLPMPHSSDSDGVLLIQAAPLPVSAGSLPPVLLSAV